MNSWNSADFKNSILAQARTKTLLKPEEYPSQIILNGWWFKILRELHKESKKKRKECSKNIKTNLPVDDLLISRKINVGSEEEVETLIELEGSSYQIEKFIGTLHTHPDNSPFSFLDLSGFLFTPRSFLKILITRNQQIMLVVRTKGTPGLGGDRKIFVKKMRSNYKPFSSSDTKHLIANLLFCQENKIVFYLGKMGWFNKNEIVLKKKIIRKK